MGEGDRTSTFEGDPMYPKEERLGQARGGLGTALTIDGKEREEEVMETKFGREEYVHKRRR